MAATSSMWAQFFWVYAVGPVAALLPEAWRRTLPVAARVDWERAAAVSGFLEIVAGFFGLCYWYMLAMTPMISQGTEWALSGRFGREVTAHQISGAALAVFATHPLTLMLVYVFAEGAVRFCGAAFMEDVRGSFPLYVFERALFLVRHRKEVRPGEVLRGHAAAIVTVLRERAMVARLKAVPDELHRSRNGAEEILEIWASRRKQDWVAPKTVRVDEMFYRLEDSTVEAGPRPFRYRLRRLEAGVMGRRVIVYESPKEEVNSPRNPE